MRILLSFLFSVAFWGNAAALPPLEVYGDLPSNRSLSVSSDGSKVARLTLQDEIEALLVYDFSSKKTLGGVNTTKVKARNTRFIGNQNVRLSRAVRIFGGFCLQY